MNTLRISQVAIAIKIRSDLVKKDIENIFILIQPLRETNFELWNKLRNLIEAGLMNLTDIKNLIEKNLEVV